MRIRKINFQEINFEYRSYPQSMYDSVRRIGLSFPVKVDIIDGKYYCKDGHKRLSIIQDLLKNEEGYQKGAFLSYRRLNGVQRNIRSSLQLVPFVPVCSSVPHYV